VATAQELLVDALVATAAIASGQFLGYDKTMVVLFLLIGCGLVTIEAVDALSGVRAHFIFVDDGKLCTRMAFRAFPRGTHQVCIGLVGLDLRPGSIY
jgi:hypothetical protein